MALPKSIQAQVDAADALMAQAVKVQEAPVSDPQATVTDAPQAPVQQAQAAPVQSSAPAQADPSVQRQDSEPWEARFRSLKGLFDQQVPLLQGKVKELEARYQEAIGSLEKLAKTPAAEVKQTAVDPKDVDSFGGDLVEMVQRVSGSMLERVAQKVESSVTNFEQRLAQLEATLQGTSKTVALNAEQMFYSSLAKAVPDFEDINSNAGFLTWLGEVDPVYGHNRQAALDAAQQQLDAGRVAAIFNAFKGTQPAPAKRDNLEKQVSPRAVAAVTTNTQQPKRMSLEAFTKASNDFARGKFRGNEEAYFSLEREFNQAMAEDRLTA